MFQFKFRHDSLSRFFVRFQRVSLIIRYKSIVGATRLYRNILYKFQKQERGPSDRYTYFCCLFSLSFIGYQSQPRRVVEMNKIYISAFSSAARLRMGSWDAALMEFRSLAFVSIMATESFVVFHLNFTPQLAGIKSYLSIYPRFEPSLSLFDVLSCAPDFITTIILVSVV